MENIDVLPGQHPNISEPPPEPQPRNKLGFAAMIIGIVAIVISFVPFVNLSVGLIGLVGLVLGIIGLTKNGQPKRQALTGVILSMVVAIVMTIVYSLMFASSLGESLEESFGAEWEIVEDDPFGGESLFDDEFSLAEETGMDEETGFDEVEWEPITEGELGPELGIADGVGAADSPLPLGTPMRIMGMRDWEYELVLGPTMLNANAYVAQADSGNKPPPEGQQYIAVDATITYIGPEAVSDGTSPSFSLGFAFSDGTDSPKKSLRDLKNVHESFTGYSLAQNESATVTYVRLVPSAEAENGMWKVTQSFWMRDVHFAVK